MKLMRQIVALFEDEAGTPELDLAASTDDASLSPTSPEQSTEPQSAKDFWDDKVAANLVKRFKKTRIFPVQQNDDGTFTVFVKSEDGAIALFKTKTHAAVKNISQHKLNENFEKCQTNSVGGETSPEEFGSKKLEAYTLKSLVDAYLHDDAPVKLTHIGNGLERQLKSGDYLIKLPDGTFKIRTKRVFEKHHAVES